MVKPNLAQAAAIPDLNAIVLVDLTSEKGCDGGDQLPLDMTFRTRYYDKDLSIVCDASGKITIEDAREEGNMNFFTGMINQSAKEMTAYFDRYRKLLANQCGLQQARSQ